MSCLERFLWTKLPRSVVPACKGILSHWAHLAARAAFRKGIAWQTDCELDTIAAELNLPLQMLDAVLSRIDAEIGMENRRLELRLERLAKTRQLLDRINDSLTSLKRKPDNGPLLYELIYLTYIGEEKLILNDILFRLNISRRHYYRLKEQAVSAISLRLWSAPTTDLEIWLSLVAMLTDGQ